MTKIPEWANYIAKNKNGEIHVFEDKPEKQSYYWLPTSVNFESIPDNVELESVQWEDEEPTKLLRIGLNVSDQAQSMLKDLRDHHNAKPNLNPDELTDYVIRKRKESWSTDYGSSENDKSVHAIMEVFSDDGQLAVRQIFSFKTECEAEIVLDYINELEPERKFYIREEAGA